MALKTSFTARQEHARPAGDSPESLREFGRGLRGRIDAIVIGASAGGVEALSTVLPALPARSGPAAVIVQHIPRESPSLLVEIFSTRCARPVREAQDKEPLEPGSIHFAPPDYHVLLDEGPQIALSVDDLVNYSRPSIDVLFESAAELLGPRALGIVLTGANGDGAAGLASIHRAGGVAVVQQPGSAQASYMPAAALRRTPDAVTLTLDQIATLLGALGNDEETIDAVTGLTNARK